MIDSNVTKRLARWWLGCAVLFIGCLNVQAAELFDPFGSAGIDQKPGASVPLATRLTDQRGRSVRLGDLLGKRPVVLAPVYYTCANVCGAQLASLFNVLEALDYRVGQDFDLIAYSFNPTETVADAQKEMNKLRQRWPQQVDAKGVYFLVGDDVATKALSDAVGFRYRYDPKVQQYAHVSAIAVLTAQGRLARWLYGLGYQPNDMRLAITEAGQGNVGSLGDQLLLLCYHYNPRVGGYDSVVMLALKIAGVMTVLLLIGFIGWALRRDWLRKGRTP
ncbi:MULTISPECIES: SCO family protein [Pseudomonas]|uniref:SCO family protein n=1 Tax=Pseudomonas TaxID=286 RepID=UPI000AD551BA|nr:SCO family protein [Pseudomonas fluorescens]